MTAKQTMVGAVHPTVLEFTAGKDAVLDQALIGADCIGSAAHVAMLAALDPPLFDAAECRAVRDALVGIMRRARAGRFRIRSADQDVHLAVERALTAELGDLGRRIHTARSRNDQVAVDMRLYGKETLLALMADVGRLAHVLLRLAARYRMVPMVGRTHLQPAMPSSVGVWASAHAESLIDDLALLQGAYAWNDRCPLGSAAGYGVPLAIDRALTARLLGFAEPIHNVLYASTARGKCESIVLGAAAQVMLSLGRLAEDMILYLMPEFGYFSLPAAYGTGSSIMPQKNNPDVFELVRARSAKVLALASWTTGVLKGLPSGYSRDLQETKEPFLEGLTVTGEAVRVAALVMAQLKVRPERLRGAFSVGVFAADRALELVAQGVPFRDAYDRVKANLDAGECPDPDAAIARKVHEGAPAGLDLDRLQRRLADGLDLVKQQRRRYDAAISKLLGVRYPALTE
jgi:argininosuccinate lyase